MKLFLFVLFLLLFGSLVAVSIHFAFKGDERSCLFYAVISIFYLALDAIAYADFLAERINESAKESSQPSAFQEKH